MRLVCFVRNRLFCFGEIDIAADFVKRDVLVEILTVQKRFSQFVEREAAASAFDLLFAIAVAGDDTAYTFGSDGFSVIAHFDENEFPVAAVGFVHVEDGVGGGAGTGKAVENDGVFIGCNLYYPFN